MTDPDLGPMAEALKQQVDEHGFIDVGENVEKDLPVSKTEFNVALTMLKDEGYQVHILRAQHLETGQTQYMKVLVGPDVSQEDTWTNREKIRLADFTQQ
jgi:hypothetical protein